MSRLLSVNNYYYRRGGADSVFLEHNRLLENAGWEVMPFAMRSGKNMRSEWERFFINELEYGEARGVGDSVVKAAKSIYSWEARRKVGQLLDHRRPDICHVHNLYHHISPSILPRIKSAGVPVVLTLHDLKLACPAYKMLSRGAVCERCRGGRPHHVLLNRCMKGSLALSTVVYTERVLHAMLGTYVRSVDAYVVPSRFYREKFRQWGFDTSRFHYIPNFVHAEVLRPRTEVGNAFVYAGRLAPEKGLDTAIRAASGAGVALDIVGTGPEESALKRTAATIGANVRFHGHQEVARLNEIIAGARALVLPSEWYENAPISLLEAYALGVPVIGASIGGIPEMIRPGATGWVFESGSVEALRDRFEEVADLSDAEILTMGSRGRALAEREYSPAAYRVRIEELYGLLLADAAQTVRA